MSFTKETSVERAKHDLAKRLKIGVSEIKELGITDKDFPDMSLGCPVNGEMSAQMISSGWQIEFHAGIYPLDIHTICHQREIQSASRSISSVPTFRH